MREVITKEVTLCDQCLEKTEYPSVCLTCKKDFCRSCAVESGVTHNSSVNFVGTGDGFYCGACDDSHTILASDRMHNAYRAIRGLRAEQRHWRETFRVRCDIAEAEVQACRSL